MILSRRRPPAGCADRTARYKEVRQAGLHGMCAAPHVSETRHYATPRDAGVPYTLCDRQIENAVLSGIGALPRIDRIGHGHMGLAERVDESHRGECAAACWAAMGVDGRAGFRSPCGSSCTLERTPTVRPDPGTKVPPARPLRLPMTAISHRREAIWRTLDNPPSAWRPMLTRHHTPAPLS